MNVNSVNQAFSALDQWITNNGWAGYDPYDIRGQDWYVRLLGRQSWFFRKLRGAFAIVESRLPPVGLRKFLRIKKEINPKGMGLLASAYLTQWDLTADPSYRDKAQEVLSWLSNNRCPDYPGASWGYPFHWQSRIFLPRGTPSVVVTATIGDAWLHHYERTRSTESLATLEEIAEFFLSCLNRPVDEDDQLCFSYTPLDHFKVHNANLFAAAFLARLYGLTDNQAYKDLALRAARYTLSEQKADGSFSYWGSEPLTIVDHYHTGFVLRHLDTVRRITSADFIIEPLARGYAFYTQRLFTQDSTPKFTPDDLYPIDIHSCSEAILCVSQLGPEFGGVELLGPLFEFTQEKMLTDEGWYLAAIRQKRGREVPHSVPYFRWGQAWMLLALAQLQRRLNDTPSILQEQLCESA
jgi:hypothetical protein